MAKLFLAPAQRYVLDANNRVRIPTAFTEALGKDAVLLPGVGGRINLMPYDYFIETHKDLFESDMYDEAIQQATSALFASTAQVTVDSLGRITFPDAIVNAYDLKKEVVFIGKGRFIEIWPAEAYATRADLLSADKISETLRALKGMVKRSEQSAKEN